MRLGLATGGSWLYVSVIHYISPKWLKKKKTVIINAEESFLNTCHWMKRPTNWIYVDRAEKISKYWSLHILLSKTKGTDNEIMFQITNKESILRNNQKSI